MAQTLLRPEQVDDLVVEYPAGATLVELASRFGVNRRTVTSGNLWSASMISVDGVSG